MFNGYRVSVQEDEKFRRWDDGESYTTAEMYLVPLNCTVNYG